MIQTSSMRQIQILLNGQQCHYSTQVTSVFGSQFTLHFISVLSYRNKRDIKEILFVILLSYGLKY